MIEIFSIFHFWFSIFVDKVSCLQDFAKENGYTNYRYLIPPKTRNFIDKDAKPKMKYTEYFNHVQMIGKSNMKSISKGSDNSSEAGE